MFKTEPIYFLSKWIAVFLLFLQWQPLRADESIHIKFSNFSLDFKQTICSSSNDNLRFILEQIIFLRNGEVQISWDPSIPCRQRLVDLKQIAKLSLDFRVTAISHLPMTLAVLNLREQIETTNTGIYDSDANYVLVRQDTPPFNLPQSEPNPQLQLGLAWSLASNSLEYYCSHPRTVRLLNDFGLYTPNYFCDPLDGWMDVTYNLDPNHTIYLATTAVQNIRLVIATGRWSLNSPLSTFGHLFFEFEVCPFLSCTSQDLEKFFVSYISDDLANRELNPILGALYSLVKTQESQYFVLSYSKQVDFYQKQNRSLRFYQLNPQLIDFAKLTEATREQVRFHRGLWNNLEQNCVTGVLQLLKQSTNSPALLSLRFGEMTPETLIKNLASLGVIQITPQLVL